MPASPCAPCSRVPNHSPALLVSRLVSPFRQALAVSFTRYLNVTFSEGPSKLPGHSQECKHGLLLLPGTEHPLAFLFTRWSPAPGKARGTLSPLPVGLVTHSRNSIAIWVHTLKNSWPACQRRKGPTLSARGEQADTVISHREQTTGAECALAVSVLRGRHYRNPVSINGPVKESGHFSHSYIFTGG